MQVDEVLRFTHRSGIIQVFVKSRVAELLFKIQKKTLDDQPPQQQQNTAKCKENNGNCSCSFETDRRAAYVDCCKLAKCNGILVKHLALWHQYRF